MLIAVKCFYLFFNFISRNMNLNKNKVIIIDRLIEKYLNEIYIII